jgi:hypothetical protein
MPLEALERSERLKSEDLPVFLAQFSQMVEAIKRLERLVEHTIDRLERSQAQAIEQGITQALAQLRTSAPVDRSETPSEVSKTPTLHREAIIARIQHAKDVEGKPFQKIADELNAQSIPTFSGKGLWGKGNVERFYKRKTE